MAFELKPSDIYIERVYVFDNTFADSKWKTCLKSVKLMPDPHSEEGSHDYFTFTNKQVIYCY